jgi:hypothetical protein
MVYGADQFKYEGKEAPARLLQKLETAGIPTKWVSEDVRAKGLVPGRRGPDHPDG